MSVTRFDLLCKSNGPVRVSADFKDAQSCSVIFYRHQLCNVASPIQDNG